MYIRIAKDGDRPAEIMFYYNREGLFDDVSLMSNFMAKNLATKDGVSLTDEYALSGDEKDLFYVCVRATLPDIFESMTKMSYGIIDGFRDDVDETGNTTGVDSSGDDVTVASGKYIEFRILDNEAYNSNILTIVDSSLNNAIKYGVLKEFYSVVIQADFYKICVERFTQELLKLNQRLFQLKKKSLRSETI